ncbi:MAG TPA: efflux RND transporter periplasmic adaptor subunit [Planctomycetota bacterium]|nr:efflux RND transporter periplasmic adaptor subunit [Planctomycetota bacterium]
MNERTAVMKVVRFGLGSLILGALGVGGWTLVRHQEWVKGAPDDDEDAAEVMAEVPVRLGKITRGTIRRYVEGFGTVEAEPAQPGKPPAAARVASPVAGILSEILCSQGQFVEKGSPLVQLDERSARAEEEKALAAVGSAKASLARLKAFPRPEQIKVAEMQVERARRGAEYARKKNGRIVQLLADQLASEKALQEAELELITAENDQAIAQKQLLLLQSSPAPEEVAEAEGKVQEAEKAWAAAQTQRSLLRILSPVAGTVLRLKSNPGEAVDLATVLVEIANLDRLVVEATVPASALAMLAVGMDVEIGAGGEAPQIPPRTPVHGKVVLVGLDADRKTDAGLVRVSVPPKSGFALGQFVRVRIVSEEHQSRLLVPRQSVVQNPEGKSVIVGFLGEKAIMKEVRVGLKEGDLIEIEGDEVDEGDAIVTQGAYGLPGEAKVRVLKDN